MKLNVLERIIALNLLPKEGNIAMLKIMEQMRMQLAFTEEEVKEWGITEVDGKTSWKQNGEKDIPFGEKASDLMIDALKRHSDKKTLPRQAISLYEKFIPS